MASGTYILRRPRGEPKLRIDYQARLNPEQYEVVVHEGGPLLVVAGAGSGKTRVLVHRVARLVELGERPSSILLLTFTRRASMEMLQRATELVGPECGRVAGGTFHSVANRILRRRAGDLGIESGFSILDRRDSEDVLQFLRSAHGYDSKERRFPRKNTVASLFSAIVNRALSLEALLEGEWQHLADHAEELATLRIAYDRYKREKNLFDYDDLLVRFRDALAEHPAVAEVVADEFRHILVDEYQDTNSVQAEIVERLAAKRGNVIAVGDDAQSIYSFRGANFRNMLDFPDRFPGARVVALEQNYRSTAPILRLANGVIERAPERYTKVLRTEKSEGEMPVLIQSASENEQSRFVCQRVLELREEGVALDRIAVLFRSGFHSFDLEIELARADVPFVKRGGFRFVESAHVKDLLAHLRVLANPRDAVSWMRALTLLPGVGPKRAAALAEKVVAAGGNFEALRDGLPKRATGNDLERLSLLLEELAKATLPPAVAMERVLAYYEPILQREYRDDHPRRSRDLEHLAAIASRYATLELMLTDFALEPPNDAVGGELADDEEEERLVLSTIHSSKGLEWHAVFVIWAAEGKFPARRSTNDDDSIEEERRLAYVAVTRAEELLYVCYPAQFYERGVGQVSSEPSRYFDGLDEEILAPVAIVEEW